MLVEDLTAVSIVRVRCGDGFSAALTSDGDVFTWGSNSHGQLATKKREAVLLPKKVSYFTKKETRVRQIALGGRHAVCVGDRDERPGIIFTWGQAVTNGFQEDQTVPTKISALKGTAFVAAGGTHTLSINGGLLRESHALVGGHVNPCVRDRGNDCDLRGLFLVVSVRRLKPVTLL